VLFFVFGLFSKEEPTLFVFFKSDEILEEGGEKEKKGTKFDRLKKT